MRRERVLSQNCGGDYDCRNATRGKRIPMIKLLGLLVRARTYYVPGTDYFVCILLPIPCQTERCYYYFWSTKLQPSEWNPHAQVTESVRGSQDWSPAMSESRPRCSGKPSGHTGTRFCILGPSHHTHCVSNHWCCFKFLLVGTDIANFPGLRSCMKTPGPQTTS